MNAAFYLRRSAFIRGFFRLRSGSSRVPRVQVEFKCWTKNAGFSEGFASAFRPLGLFFSDVFFLRMFVIRPLSVVRCRKLF